MDLKEVQERLRTKSYEEVGEQLEGFDSSSLMTFLDASVVKVGDVAAEILANRGDTELLVQGIVRGTISTKLGRVRALNMLHRFGKSCSLARTAYLTAIFDKTGEVIDCALFGLAFLQDETAIPALREARLNASKARVVDRFSAAIDAIEKKDPHLYSPYFWDKNNVWGLQCTVAGNGDKPG